MRVAQAEASLDEVIDVVHRGMCRVDASMAFGTLEYLKGKPDGAYSRRPDIRQ
jgi:Txe/YoeB family toxin of Txe-Axe toxin-antitoxin module